MKIWQMLIYKIFLFLLFFSKYLTWIIQIRTCWGEAGCCFYSHLFRESTENILQHGHPEPKKRKHGTFFFFFEKEDFQKSKIWRILGGWLAGWPVGTTPVLECLWFGNKAQSTKEHRFIPRLSGAGSKAEYLEALIHLPAVDFMVDLELYDLVCVT